MFRLLAEHPGPDVTAAAAAGLTGTRPAQAGEALTELCDLHLIDEHTPGRFAFHDLLRLYATEIHATASNLAERRAAGRRMVDHYLHTATSAALAISPARSALDLEPAVAGANPENLPDPGAATDWLRAEHQVLMRVIGYAAGHGFDTHAWQLPWALTNFLGRGGHWPDFAASQRTALAAATRLGDIAAQAHAHRYLGRAYLHLQDHQGALRHFTRALDLRRQPGALTGRADISLDLCNVHELRGELDEAPGCARRALALYQPVSHRIGEAHAITPDGDMLRAKLAGTHHVSLPSPRGTLRKPAGVPGPGRRTASATHTTPSACPSNAPPVTVRLASRHELAPSQAAVAGHHRRHGQCGAPPASSPRICRLTAS
jgi:hypothetical protein